MVSYGIQLKKQTDNKNIYLLSISMVKIRLNLFCLFKCSGLD